MANYQVYKYAVEMDCENGLIETNYFYLEKYAILWQRYAEYQLGYPSRIYKLS